ncbi:MAG: helix-turn-helix transcriptional regulator, partial [Candidatus Eremiobacteraeota bacterium]|nr:helix-turn-helix transcriptional regulator [Candidatus Eremiobacteraeota bacterium]
LVAFLRGLVDATIPRLRWILIGRDAAAFPVARWLASGIADLPVDDDDLRIDPDELRVAVAAAGLPLRVDALGAATLGRPLRLALALSGHADDGEDTEELRARLVDVALAARGETARTQFYEAALLMRFDVQLLRALGHDADATIAALRDAGFVYGDGAYAFAFDPPFREELLARIDALDPAQRDALHARAAAALAAHGRWSEAVALYRRAGAHEQLAAALDARGFLALDLGEVVAVRRALAVLPDDVAAHHPVTLGMKAALASLDERFDVAEAWFRMAIDAAADDDDARRAIVVRYGLDLVRRGRSDVVALLEAEVAREGAGTAFAAELWGVLATAYVGAHRLDDAHRAARNALTRLRDVADEGVRARILHQSAYVALNSGDHGAAKQLAQRAYESAEAAYLYDLAARALSVLHNVAIFHDDDVPAGRLALAKLAEAGRKAGSTTLRLYATLNAYGLEVDAGDAAAIERLDGELRELQIFLTPMASEALLPAQALRAAWDGRFEYAYQLLAPSAEKLFDDERTAYRWAEVAVYAAAAGRRSESDAAIRHARENLRRADPADRLGQRARAYLALAEVLQAHQGRANRALAELKPVARRAGPRFAALLEAIRALHVRWTTGWHGKPALADALDHLETVDLGGVGRFIGALPLPSSDRGRVTLLSDAEKRILSLVAAGSTSKEIGAELDRSPQTIDVHIRSICRKLGCSGRRQAVAFALREGLIVKG